MNLGHVFAQGDLVLITVFIILMLMSIATWVIIIWRGIRLYQAKKANAVAHHALHHAHTLQESLRVAQNHPSLLSNLTASAIAARQSYLAGGGVASIPLPQYLVQHIRNDMDKMRTELASGMTILASVGATAPFIGLFGTVWGIYHALINISVQGQVNIATVAGPIGEALVATAVGLFAAIPAVLAYNFIVYGNKKVMHSMDGYAYDLHVQLLNQKD